ncbi:lipase [Flagelloscypha sp. PMI_526]|nr:lipase [Flagelloscypha sp. PMI_526]
MVKLLLQVIAVALCSVSTVSASPLERRSVTALTTAQINAYTPYTWYASAANCAPSTLKTWTCGANCNANPGFKPQAAGGDGSDVQYWFVGYDPTLKSVIVGHEATDTSDLLPILTDADIILSSLNTTLFPGVSSDIKVHSGFKESFEDTATTILAQVKTALSTNGVSKIAVTGWSLGAAISILDGLYLKLQIPTADVSVYGYGMPRVGNAAWAAYVDSKLSGKVTHINNKDDLVPILPGRFLGFAHVSGEVHIKDDNSWVACSGEDNTDSQCTVGTVTNIFVGDAGDHPGPYNGITLGC